MSKKIIERDLRKDYAKTFFKVNEEEAILVADVVQIIDDFMEKRNLQKPDHWKACVEKYYLFYQDKFGAKPDFTKQIPRLFKELIEKIKRSTEQKGDDWTEENAVRELGYILDAAFADKWLKGNFLMTNLNTQYQKLRDARSKEVMYFEDLKKVYVSFYKGKFGLEPDLNDGEIEELKGIIEKLRLTAEQKSVAWTKVNAEGYLIKLLGLAYKDKWIKQHFLVVIINKYFQALRDNERARQKDGDKKNGRLGETGVKDFLARRKAHTDSQTNSGG